MKKILCLLFICMSFIAFSQQQKRYALVVGNSNYQSGMTALSNPVNDADDMAASLKSLGFTVQLVKDCDLPALQNAVTLFKNRLSTDSDTVGMFYYAGHGVQAGGHNYLIPVDADIPSENYLQARAFSVQILLDELNTAGNYLNMIVLDACRDNPFGWSRSRSRGLSVVGRQPAGSIIVYATSAGTVAQDGVGRNGPFTAELLKHLKTPGLEISEIFRKTGAGVSKQSGGRQIPAVYNQFFDTLVLKSRAQELVENIDRPRLRESIQPTIIAGSTDKGRKVEILDLDNNGSMDIIANGRISFNRGDLRFSQLEPWYLDTEDKQFHDKYNMYHNMEGFREKFDMSIAFQDINGDSFMDLITTDYDSVFVYNNNNGTISESGTPLADITRFDVPLKYFPADLNMDGSADFIALHSYLGYVYWLNPNESTGSQSLTKLFEFGTAFHAACHDFDNDGDADIVVNNEEGEFFLFENDGRMKFTRKELKPWDGTGMYTFSVYDFDGDNDADIFLDIPNESMWLINDGDNVFIETTIQEPGRHGRVADVDSDGDLDMVLRSPNGMWIFGQEDGTFYSDFFFKTDMKIYDFQIAELNNKPGMEIVYTVEENGNIYILEPWEN